MQLGLQEPLVVLDAVLVQVGLHLGDVALQAEGAHILQPLLLGSVLVAVAVDGVEGLGQLLDVLALVALLGELIAVLTQDDLHVPGVNGLGKLVHLVAGIVDVELLPGVVAHPGEHVGQGVTQHAAAGVTHVHGAGGVGGDELHHHLLAVAHVAGAVSGGVLLHRTQHLLVPVGGVEEVQKAGAGNLSPLEQSALQLQVVQNDLGNGTGGHLQCLGPRHGKGGGKVPVSAVLGHLYGASDGLTLGQQALGGGLLIGLLGQFRHLVPGGLNQICHRYSLLCSLTPPLTG